MTTARTITLRLPADAAFLSVARLFGSSVARIFELDAERAEDLRLVLSEICAAATEGGADTESDPSIDIDVSWDGSALRFSCLGVPTDADGPRWTLVRALMPDVRVDGAVEPTVSFSIDR